MCEILRFTAFQIEKEEVTEDYNTVDVAQRCNAIIDSLRATLQVYI